MIGLFAQWQPRYAERGVATFPIVGKKPRVTNWQRIGLPGSAQLAKKFAEDDAFGFVCGPHNGITVVDIDSPDHTVVTEAYKLLRQISNSMAHGLRQLRHAFSP